MCNFQPPVDTIDQSSYTVTCQTAMGSQPVTLYSLVHSSNCNRRVRLEEIAGLIPRLFPPPVFDHLQCTNTEGEDLGDLVTCSDVRYTWGAVPNEVSQSSFCNVHLRPGSQNVCKAAIILFVGHNTKDGWMRNGNYYGRSLPPVCPLSICLTSPHVTRSPGIFAYCK